MTWKRPISLALLFLLPLSGARAQGRTADQPSYPIAVVGDWLSCPKSGADEIGVCGDAISTTALLRLQAYASCLVVHHQVQADIATHAYAERHASGPLRELVDGDRSCMPGRGARMSAILLASAIAEHLPGWRGRLHSGFTPPDRTETMIQCLIAASPRLALAMLRAAPLSKDEYAAARLLVPNMSGCLPKGVQFETNLAGLRAMLVLALFENGSGADVLVAEAPTPLLADPAAPRPIAMPRITMLPMVVISAPRGRTTAIATMPSWTEMPEFGLHHGGYSHPDLPQRVLPEDELSAVASLPDANGGDTVSPLRSSFPGATTPAAPDHP